MKKIGFSEHPNFSELSVRDLLDAREHYHVHLSNKENVVATAVGRYLIRIEDPDAKDPDGTKSSDFRTYQTRPPRTLSNTVVKPWSWPCVIVFVSRWLAPEEFAKKMDQAVPRFLYLPDGRVIPTCVVFAEAVESSAGPLTEFNFPDRLVGGGYPMITDVQGNQHVGSVGCMVTDGNLTFALTNRHVAGPVGAEAYSLVKGDQQVLGASSELQLSKYPVAEVYPGHPSSRALLNLDAGLIQVEDVNDWTAQVYGIGEVGPLVDINPDTVSLDLIGAPVKAFGAGSGPLLGEIQALFYRYKSLGGLDYVTDFLIGSKDRTVPLATRPADSGTVWFLDETPPDSATAGEVEAAKRQGSRPIALQWGGHRFLSGSGEEQFQFALASNLSAICRLLDVQIVREWNRGLPEFWGPVGHYKVGHLACSMVSSPKLQALFGANADRVGIDDDGLLNRSYERLDEERFVPLADVPDVIWRSLPARNADDSNHFADMDEEGNGEFAGMTLLDLCQDEANIDVTVWNQFYESIGASKRGAVPFRVWQIYDEMVEFVRQRDIPRYLCAAGILAHYVGDCGQSLHISRLHHGRPDRPAEKSVHSVYETNMLKLRAVQLLEGLAEESRGMAAESSLNTGRGAAIGLIQLMKETIERIPPMDVIRAFNSASGQERVGRMWDALGSRTITSIANASLYLATLWESAWEEGGGNAEGADEIADEDLGPVDRSRLRRLYLDTDFIKSYTLRQMEDAGVLGVPA